MYFRIAFDTEDEKTIFDDNLQQPHTVVAVKCVLGTLRQSSLVFLLFKYGNIQNKFASKILLFTITNCRGHASIIQNFFNIQQSSNN